MLWVIGEKEALIKEKKKELEGRKKKTTKRGILGLFGRCNNGNRLQKNVPDAEGRP